MERGRDYTLERKWERDTTNVRADLGVSRDFNPWTTVVGAQSVPATFRREREVVEVGWVVRMQEREWSSFEEAAEGFYADVSQGVAQCPYGSLHTLCTGQTHQSEQLPLYHRKLCYCVSLLTTVLFDRSSFGCHTCVFMIVAC